jgi:hypothetical protein
MRHDRVALTFYPAHSEDGTPLSENQKKKRAAKAEKERKKAETAARLAAEKQAKEASEVVSALPAWTERGSLSLRPAQASLRSRNRTCGHGMRQR